MPHTFYTTAIGTMALSVYIYLITKLRDVVKETLYTELEASLEKPLLFHRGLDLMNNTIHLM